MKRTLSASSVAAVAGLAAADTYYTGDGTAYTLGSVSSGNCNFMYDPGVGSNYAALNAAQWDDTLNCGRCAEVSCADDACSDTTSTVTVYLVDQCPECEEGDLDLSPTVFKTLTGSDPARYTIKWRFVDCPVSGNLQYCAKSGSSSYWLAVQPANMLTGVASMTIGGKTPSMVDSAYYFLLDSGGVDMSAVEIATTSVSGETVTETVSLTADSCTAGSKQFSGGSSSSSSTTTSSSNETPKLTTPTPTTAAPATTSAPATTAPATTAPTATTATPSKQSSDSSAGTTTTGESTEDTQVANDFDTLNDGSSNETAVVGTVSAPEGESSSSGVSILDSSETGVANTPTSTSSTSTDDSGTEEANTKSADSSSATSPVLIALAVAAAVGAVALAAVYVRVQKKKIDDKVNDRDDNAMQRSFDTFNSPVRVTSAIAQI